MNYQNLLYAADYLNQVISLIAQDANCSHATKAVMAILQELNVKISKKLIGEVKAKYKLKLTLAEKHALYYVRNEYAPKFGTVVQDNAVLKLLK